MTEIFATLTDETGFTNVFHDGALEDFDGHTIEGVLYMWEQGNFSCDCNRSLFLYDRDEDKCLPCNDGENKIKLISLTVGGEEILPI